MNHLKIDRKKKLIEDLENVLLNVQKDYDPKRFEEALDISYKTMPVRIDFDIYKNNYQNLVYNPLISQLQTYINLLKMKEEKKN